MANDTSKKPVAIMFSGGSDSLSLLALAYKGKLKGIAPPSRIHLLYMLNGMSRFPEFPRQRYRMAQEILQNQREVSTALPQISYIELDTARLFQGLWIDHYEEMMPRYNGKNLVCVACKIAMHARSIIYCRENNIDTFVTGYAKKQEYYPEQTPTFMNTLATFSEKFGVHTRYPVFEDFSSVGVVRHFLEDQGLPSASGGERNCLFGQTYTTAAEEDTARFLADMLPVVANYLEAYFSGDIVSATECFPPGRVRGKLLPSSWSV